MQFGVSVAAIPGVPGVHFKRTMASFGSVLITINHDKTLHHQLVKNVAGDDWLFCS